MQNLIVRMLSMELNGFKNVKYGKIDMPAYVSGHYTENNSEILGIYGQNGSGKTAVIDALSFLKDMMMGLPLQVDASDYICISSAESILSFKFYISNPLLLVTYRFVISKAEDGGVEIKNEKVGFSRFTENKWSKELPLIDYSTQSNGSLFKPKYRCEEILSKNKDNEVNLSVARVVAKKEMKSFIFSDEAREILGSGVSRDINWSSILFPLRFYAFTNLFIVKNSHNGIINLDFAIPFSFKHVNSGYYAMGDMVVSLNEPSVFRITEYNIFKTIIDEMNLVLNALIPGLSLEIKEHGAQLTKDSKEGMRFELKTKRGESFIPLKYESEGIKKMLSILNIIIAMYNNPSICLAVDELDAGIFEYLLGELLNVIEESGKGQLIFTSHNLRPLEMINKSSMIFTTTNPENRYIRLTNVKSTNNLRDLYLRSINLGGQKEPIYESTKEYEIRRALRKAGRDINAQN